MTDDPYRDVRADCPDCKKGPMREFQNRLVCDDCTGIFLKEADLKTAVDEVAGQDTTVRYTDAGSSTALCPRCTNPMLGHQIEVVGICTLRDPAPRCASHGVWMANGKLPALFAAIGHKLHFGAAQGRAYGGVGGQGNSSYTLLRERMPRNAPMPMTDPYAGRTLACPACGSDAVLGFHGDRWLCDRCGGAFVANAALEFLVIDVANEYYTLPAPTGELGARSCPVCSEPLVVEQWQHVTIDRCAKHGIWFDPKELGEALEFAGGVAPAQEPRGVARWIQHLFGSRARR